MSLVQEFVKENVIKKVGDQKIGEEQSIRV